MEDKKGLFRSIKGDLSGAVSVAFVVLPLSIGYGIMAFAALGPVYTSQAALAGVYGAVFTGLFASLLCGTSILITGTRASLTLVLASVVASLVQNPSLSGPVLPLNQIVSLAFLCVFMGGAFQVLFGVLRLGEIVKYIPYPVIAGFMNGIAILIIYNQINPLLGMDAKSGLWRDLAWLDQIKPLSLLVGVFTLAMVYSVGRFLKSVPASLAALIAGTALYYLVWFMKGPASLGPVIGSLAVNIPTPSMLQGFLDLIFGGSFLHYLRILLVPAIIIGVFGSIESLLSAVAVDNLISTSHDSNRVLVGQGVGNMIASLFGGIAGAGMVASTMANYKAGGRTLLSGVGASVILLLTVILFGRFAGMVPLAAVAGIIISLGIAIFDRWSLSLAWKVIKTRELPPETKGNLFVTFLVTGLTVTVNLVVAIVLGFGVATALFLSKMGSSVIRHRFSGSQLMSKKVRPVEESRFLHDHGNRIQGFELYGPIFFGTAEKLAKEIENSAQEVRYVILDIKRVNVIDSTGARIIGRIHRNLDEKGKSLFVSYMDENHPSWMTLTDMGVIAKLGVEHLFVDTDRALECAEEHLLNTLSARTETGIEIALETFGVFKDLDEREQSTVKERLKKRVYKKGEIVIREGSPDRDLLFLTKGEVSIGISLSEKDHSKRLAAYSPGAVFGEVELLDGSPRSANAWAVTDTEIFHLTSDDYESLRIKHPDIAHKLVVSLARELSFRLRMTNRDLRLQEES